MKPSGARGLARAARRALAAAADTELQSVDEGQRAHLDHHRGGACQQLLPAGTFEYQHSYGDTRKRYLTRGFDLWAQVDLVVFQDALRNELAHCTSMADELGGRAPAARAVRPRGAPRRAAEAAEEEEHPFCPCCLFTNTWDAFKPQIESDGVYGVRLYAARDSQGQVQADCRVNGEDWPAGAQALRAYVAQWPDRGFEFRKQYVVIQSPPET
jgi:hypothetical protein